MSLSSRSVALSVLVAATLPLMRTPLARAHGGAKPVMAAPDLAPATDEPIVLGVVEAGGYRLTGTVMQEDQLEIEIEIDRPIDPPDPLLGGYGPASDLAVTITLLQGDSVLMATRPAHPESDANVYGVHGPQVAAGSYVVRVEITSAGAAAVVAELPFVLAAAAHAVPAGGAMAMDMTHPFLAHMGMPDPPGAASVRITGMQRVGELGRGGDVAIHIEAGVLPNLGIHLRNDAITGAKAGDATEAAEDHGTELMLMYAFLTDAEKTRALSVVAEVSWPSMKGDMRTVNVGAGLAARYQWSDRVLFDADVHVAPEGGTVELGYEVSLQARPAGHLYPILEARGNLGGGGDRKLYLLPAVKVGLGGSNGVVGVGLQFPLTKARDYDRQAMFQLDWDF